MTAYHTAVMLDNPVALYLLNDAALPALDTNPTPFGPYFPSTGSHGTITMGNVLGFNFGAGFPTSTPTFGTQFGGIILPGFRANLNTMAMSFEAWVNWLLDARALTTSGSYEQATTRLAPGFNPTLVLYNILGLFPNIGLSAAYSGSPITGFNLQAYLNGQSNVFGNIALNSWHHVAVSYAGFGSSSRTLYVDGQPVGTSTNGTTADWSGQTMRIGEEERWIGYDTTIKGSIGGAAIYNYALTAQQWLNHYNAAANNAQNQQSDIYTPFPTNKQPWDLPGVNQIEGWITETYNGGGSGATPAIGQQVLAGVVSAPPYAVKYWTPPSAINPLG
jgi:Concanavalin A-like lectin/glucanases superfamily